MKKLCGAAVAALVLLVTAASFMGCASPSGGDAGGGSGSGGSGGTGTALTLSTTFVTMPTGVDAVTNTPLVDLVIPCETNTTGDDLIGNGSFKIKSPYLQATAVFSLPVLQGPYTVEVQTCNTGSSADGFDRYAVVTDDDGVILAVGDVNPRMSNPPLVVTTYSYTGTDIVALQIQGIRVTAGTAAPSVGSNVSAYENLNTVTTANCGFNYGKISYSGMPKSDVTAPANVTGLSATPDNATSKVTLSWTPPADSDFAGVVIAYTNGTDSDTDTVLVGTNVWTSPFLANGTYTFTVTTFDINSNVSATSESVANVVILANDVTPPADVTSLNAAYTAGDNKVTLTWVDPTDVDFNGVDITYSDGSTTSSVSQVSSGVQTWISPVLADGTYTFTVKTRDLSANTSTGITSSSVAVLYVDTTAPNEVSALSANNLSVAGDTVVLTWTASNSSDLDHYLVSYVGGPAASSIPSGTNTATVTGLTAGTTYDFTVKAVDVSGNISTGVTSTVTTKIGYIEKFETMDGVAQVAGTYTAGTTHTFVSGMSWVIGASAGTNAKVQASVTSFTSAKSAWNIALVKSSYSSIVIPVTANCTIKVATKGTAGRDIVATATGGTLDTASFTLTGAAEEATFTYTGTGGNVTLTTTNTAGSVPVYFVIVANN